MLKAIDLRNVRGVRTGNALELTGLTVLLGPNGSGKSTVLEGLFLGSTRQPAAALGRLTRRRRQTWNGARWFLHGGPDAVGEISAFWADGAIVTRRIAFIDSVPRSHLQTRLVEQGAPGPYSSLEVTRKRPTSSSELPSTAAFAADNAYVAEDNETELPQFPFVRLVDPSDGEPLHDLYSRAVRAGLRAQVLEQVRAVVPGVLNMEVLTETSQPRLFLTFANGAVPATLAGDGVASMLRTAFELAACREGSTALLEEPEVHQHPRSLLWGAKSIVAAVERGVQVILTTHSLELLDLLLGELAALGEDHLAKACVVRTKLIDGELRTVRISGTDASDARTDLQEDLR